MKLRDIVIALFCFAAAFVGAAALGLFDARTKIQPTRIFLEEPSPTIKIAPLDEALTFARLADGQTLAVFSYESGRIEAAALPAGEDAIGLANRLGYEAVKRLIENLSARISVDAAMLVVPVDLASKHIAAGTNYRQHAEEASVEGGPFLFPKYVTPTSSRATIPAGQRLLDYEVELCLVAMKPIPAAGKAAGGLILCNDVTDRASLLRRIDPDDPQSGKGFTSGKSAEGFLPVGDLFVIPRNLDAFVSGITLQLSVDGAERQHVKATQWIWDFDRILDEARAKKEVEWNYWGGTARLPFDKAGAIPERTMIMAGTPGGTIFKEIYPSAYARGVFSWVASGFDSTLPVHVVEAHIRAAEASGDYLQPGSLVTIEVDTMGALANRVE